MKFNTSLWFVLLLISFGAKAQGLKTYEGPYAKGNAVYQYYDSKDEKKLLEGSFLYTEMGFVSTTIKGNYTNNAKEGAWQYEQKSAHDKLIKQVQGSYAKGQRQGTWTYTDIDKVVEPEKTKIVQLQFKNDTLVGAVSFPNCSGTLDANGRFTGHWVAFNDNYHIEADFKNGLLIQMQRTFILHNTIDLQYTLEDFIDRSNPNLPLEPFRLGAVSQKFDFKTVRSVVNKGEVLHTTLAAFFDILTTDLEKIDRYFIELNPIEVVPVQLVVLQKSTSSASTNPALYTAMEAEQAPVFEGGMQQFAKFISNHFDFQNEEASGTLMAKVYVETDGSLSNITILRDIGFGAGKEFARVLKLSPLWEPAKIKGQAVRCIVQIPLKIAKP